MRARSIRGLFPLVFVALGACTTDRVYYDGEVLVTIQVYDEDEPRAWTLVGQGDPDEDALDTGSLRHPCEGEHAWLAMHDLRPGESQRRIQRQLESGWGRPRHTVYACADDLRLEVHTEGPVYDEPMSFDDERVLVTLGWLPNPDDEHSEWNFIADESGHQATLLHESALVGSYVAEGLSSEGYALVDAPWTADIEISWAFERFPRTKERGTDLPIF